MIAFVKGVIASKDVGSVIIETASGVGYQIHTTVSTLESMGGVGCEAVLFTHYHVREDAALLYGFYRKEELATFKMLISVSGVGPKAAISILSSMPPEKFSFAVISGDAKALSKAPGVGLKTAQRIIVELRDKFKKSHAAAVKNKEDGMDAVFFNADCGQGALGTKSKAAEAVGALMVLGYSQGQAAKAVGDVYNDELGVEDIIMKALRLLSIA